MVVAREHLKKLDAIKEDVNQSYTYNHRNVQRFKDFINLVFNSSLTQRDIAELQKLQKPQMEFNVLESYISRLIGDFQQNEPEFKVSAADGVPIELLDNKFFMTMELITDHLREALDSSKKDGLKTKVMKEMLAGGYSVVKVYPDYVSEMSFEQNIYVDKVFDSTLTGFDPMARDSHKGDGRYCFEICPFTLERYKAEFGEMAKTPNDYARVFGQFNWSYMHNDEPIVMVVDYYEKKMKREKIAKLENGMTILKRHYNDFVKRIRDDGILIVPPKIISERWTNIQTIDRYRVNQNEVMEHKETSYKYLPLVFFDGNGVVVYDTNSNSSQFMTRPFVYHAKDIQRLKNFAGQTIANEIENMKMTQWKVALESIPPDYVDAYKNPQKLQSLVYYAFDQEEPEKALPPPMEVQRTQTPSVVAETFLGSDAVTQTILGSYDAQQGHIGNQDLSGKAIQMGAMQSNAASMPYGVGYINGMNRLAQIYIDLLPKYYVTPRTLPVKRANGKRDYVVINNYADPESILMNYNPDNLNVEVELGVSTAMQKQMALEMTQRLMSTSELFSEFMNTEGLEPLLDNIDIRGIDELKAKAAQFMERKRQALLQQEEKEAQEMSDTDKLVNAEVQTEMMKTEQKREEAQQKAELEAMKIQNAKEKDEANLSAQLAQISVEEQKAFNDFLEAYAKVVQADEDAQLKLKQQDIEEARLLNEMSKEGINEARQKFNEANDDETYFKNALTLL